MSVRMPNTIIGRLMMMKAKVFVTTKQDVIDPQGKATEGALHKLGFAEVGKVRIGKYIELELNTNDREEAERQVNEMCEKLLVNTVVEEYRIELTEEER